MGLFDSLKKAINTDAVKNAVGEDVFTKLEKATKEIEKSGFTTNSNASAPSRSEPANEPEPVFEAPKKTAVVRDRFDDFDAIISRNFADTEVRRNVPASELQPGCHPACTPVQFMFYRDGAPVLAVVLVKENNYRGMNVVATKKICESLGIRYIRFYHEYENREDYVVNRIRENL
jgi:hypothetical protein